MPATSLHFVRAPVLLVPGLQHAAGDDELVTDAGRGVSVLDLPASLLVQTDVPRPLLVRAVHLGAPRLEVELGARLRHVQVGFFPEVRALAAVVVDVLLDGARAVEVPAIRASTVAWIQLN